MRDNGADFAAHQRNLGDGDRFSLDDPATGSLKIRDKEAAPEENPFAQCFDLHCNGLKHVSAE